MKYLPRRESIAKRRGKASRATEASVDKHQSAMDAISKASLSTKANLLGQEPHPAVREAQGDEYKRPSMDSAALHILGQSGPTIVGSREQKVSEQNRKGLISDQEAIKEKSMISLGKKLRGE
jgi:hypothetical protein